MKILIIPVIILLLIISVNADIVIDEIMYNPEGADNNQEFVELYLDEIINLENYLIEDQNSQDILETLQFIDNSNYALIVEEGFDYNNIQASVYSAGATIGNNLNNDEDTVTIKDPEENIIDEVEYSDELGADNNGMSLCKIDDEWRECISTPGEENDYIQDGIFTVEYVHDGDTLRLENGEWVRLTGIDTPERGEYYYEEATDRLRELVEGEQVFLESDIENRDIYNRLLRYIYLDDLFVNLILVEEGFARAYPFEPNIRYEDEFAEAEERARENNLGIWGEENPENELEERVEILEQQVEDLTETINILEENQEEQNNRLDLLEFMINDIENRLNNFIEEITIFLRYTPSYFRKEAICDYLRDNINVLEHAAFGFRCELDEEGCSCERFE